MRTIDWVDGAIEIIDQTALPDTERTLRLESVDDLIDAIQRLAVRGAPAIGIAGALGVALAAQQGVAGEDLEAQADKLRAARPTAVNLAWGVDQVMAVADQGPDAMLARARALVEADVAANRALGHRGADLLEELVGDRARLMTHCNAGGLACVEWGTALGIVRAAHERGHVASVLATETRPLLQGARLTAYELARMGVEHHVVVDSAGPAMIARGEVDAVVVGADRIAANGDVANKIGTYSLALAANAAGIPFIVAAPESTIDLATATGADIEIEERDPTEVTRWSPARNPAFDVTPARLVTAIVTDTRVIRTAEGATP